MNLPFAISQKIFLAFTILALTLVLFGCESREQAKQMFKMAEESFNHGDYAKAVSEYQTLVDRFIGGELAARARLRIGDIYNFHQLENDENIDSSEMAIRVYKNLIETHQDRRESFQAQERIARIYAHVLKNCDQAEVEYKKIIESRFYQHWHDNPAQWQYLIGECFFLQNRYNDAIVAYGRLIDNYPEDPLAAKAMFQIADSYYLNKDYPSAVREYEELAQIYPESDLAQEALFWSGMSYELLGEEKQALKVYESLLESYPKPELVQKRVNWLAKKK